MKANVLRASALAMAITAAITAAAASSALAQPQGPGYGPGAGPGGGYGPGMMGGYGPGMMGGGYGPGPGMMGGGYGPGGGYGTGMMGGYGPGASGGSSAPGMMGGGFGPGGPLAALNLTTEQQDKVLAIQEENRRRNWDTMGKMRAETFELRRMFNGGQQLDANAIAEQQKKVDELRRQVLRSRVEAHNQIAQVLTPEQREQLRAYGPWWADESQ
jgi:Spy/CpxP family protein refolding chaperone